MTGEIIMLNALDCNLRIVCFYMCFLHFQMLNPGGRLKEHISSHYFLLSSSHVPQCCAWWRQREEPSLLATYWIERPSTQTWFTHSARYSPKIWSVPLCSSAQHSEGFYVGEKPHKDRSTHMCHRVIEILLILLAKCASFVFMPHNLVFVPKGLCSIYANLFA